MHSGPVCVAMNDALHARRTKRSGNRLVVDVHDVGSRFGRVLLAARARLIRQQLPVGDWQGEKSALPVRVTHDAAQFLIRMIVGAQSIAVRQEHTLAVEFGDDWIRKQPRAGAVAKLAADKKIAVAVQDEARDAVLRKLTQAGANTLLVRVGVVVADPRLEQISEDVHSFGAGPVATQKFQELLYGLRRAAIQMNVRDEEPRHILCSGR